MDSAGIRTRVPGLLGCCSTTEIVYILLSCGRFGKIEAVRVAPSPSPSLLARFPSVDGWFTVVLLVGLKGEKAVDRLAMTLYYDVHQYLWRNPMLLVEDIHTHCFYSGLGVMLD